MMSGVNDNGGGGGGDDNDDGEHEDGGGRGDVDEEQPLISPSSSSGSVPFVPSPVANMPRTSATTSHHRLLPQQPTPFGTAATLTARKLRSGVGAALKSTHANKKSVYRWLNIRRLDRSRLIVFTIGVAFVVYVVAWLNGAFDEMGAGGGAAVAISRVVVVRDGAAKGLMSEEDEMLNEPDVGFLVSSAECRIPALDPLAEDVMRLFHLQSNTPTCHDGDRGPLTYIERDHRAQLTTDDNVDDTAADTAFVDTVRLRVNASLLAAWGRRTRIDHCCWQRIERAGSEATADFRFNLGRCDAVPLNGSAVELPAPVEFVLVRCKGGPTAVYTNAHAVVRERPEVRRRQREAAAARRRAFADTAAAAAPSNASADNAFNGTAAAPTATRADAAGAGRRPLSVLMLGIDSISRLNLLRAMPQTAQHLYDSGWYELQGYNKIDDNTFPNLMAILLGYNSSRAYAACRPRDIGALDRCPFVWSAFRRAGYATAYAEDETAINTFNYNKMGFRRPPTDYYLRPYMLAAEKHLPSQRRHSLTFCLGGRHSADHVYAYALDFARTYQGRPFFGLFWANTFSHNDLSDPSSMDAPVLAYLRRLEATGVLADTAVVFLSDHGIRFGPVRHLHTGWLEERLPFMFVWLPAWFRRQHPRAAAALRANRNRLTTPYDLHVTLRHVLKWATPEPQPVAEMETAEQTAAAATAAAQRASDVALAADSCPHCQSLFEPMARNRSCAAGGIDAHWCTCLPYAEHSRSDAIVLSAVRFVLKHANDALREWEREQRPRRQLCAQLSMRRVSYAGRALQRTPLSTGGFVEEWAYLVVFQAQPGDGWFESTVVQGGSGRFRMSGSVSRLNAYQGQSECMANDTLRKYCYCLRHRGR